MQQKYVQNSRGIIFTNGTQEIVNSKLYTKLPGYIIFVIINQPHSLLFV